METPWTTRRGDQLQRNAICIKLHLISESAFGDPSSTTAYHPQTDGQTERVNQEVEQFLRIFVNQRQDDWNEWLAIAEYAYNDRIHASTHSSPFMMDMGQNPRLGIEPLRESHLETLNNFTSQMEAATKEACSALSQVADDMAHFYNAHRREAPLYMSETRSGSMGRILL